jgi:hypothetical protein
LRFLSFPVIEAIPDFRNDLFQTVLEAIPADDVVNEHPARFDFGERNVFERAKPEFCDMVVDFGNDVANLDFVFFREHFLEIGFGDLLEIVFGHGVFSFFVLRSRLYLFW